MEILGAPALIIRRGTPFMNSLCYIRALPFPAVAAFEDFRYYTEKSKDKKTLKYRKKTSRVPIIT